MSRINSSKELKDRIIELEARKIIAEEALKRQFHETLEDLSLIHI